MSRPEAGQPQVVEPTNGETLVVSEVFGPTLQGEGPSVGRAAGFVRLGRCNLSCTWCDSRYTWDWERYDPGEELRTVGVQSLLDQLESMRVGMVVVTGGEPLLQQRHLVPLLRGAKVRRWRVEVETSGTIAPDLSGDLVDQFNVSPKLAHSGNEQARAYRPDVLRSFRDSGRAVFKFVVRTPSDLDEVASMVDECGLDPVYVMPEGTDAATVTARMRQLAEPVLARGWNLTPRLHILLWGDGRGR
ncbi:MAG: 7-carboxy-7-deazaguanine synthase QueE [Actinomycetota bacterium]|nr:7-carboxy-7-deazaguanine synthase QueE [Actinomycetota bacterium]